MPAGGLTVPAVLDQRAEQFGDRVMMSIAGTPVTFAQMRDRSCAAANVLAELGVRRGETVALFTGACPEWVYFWLGAARIGAVSAAVNGASKGEFLSHALRLSQCRARRTRRHRRIVLHIGHNRAVQGGRDHVALPVPRGGYRCDCVGIGRG